MKLFFSHYRHAEYEQELYAPLRASALNQQHEIILPHEHGAVVNTKAAIKDADIVFAEVSNSATGVGIEIGWADAFGKPIVCLYKQGTKPSSSLQFVTKDFIEYAGSSDLVEKVISEVAKRV